MYNSFIIFYNTTRQTRSRKDRSEQKQFLNRSRKAKKNYDNNMKCTIRITTITNRVTHSIALNAYS